MLSRLAWVCVLIMGFSSTTRAEEPVALRFSLDWVPQGQSAAVLIAEQEGYFREEGLKVTVDAGRGSTDAITQIAGGAYDLGFADINALIEFAAKQSGGGTAPIGVFMVHERPPHVILSRRHVGITKPTDLAGKTIGGTAFDSVRVLFPLYAARAGVNAAQVNWQIVDGRLRATLLMRGEYGAMSAFEFSGVLDMVALGAKQEEISVLRLGDHIEIYGNAVLASRQIVAKNPEAVRRFLRGYAKGLQVALSDPAKAGAAILKRDSLANAETETQRATIFARQNVASSWTAENGLGSVDPARLERSIEQVSEALNLPRRPKAAEIFSAAYLPEQQLRTLPPALR